MSHLRFRPSVSVTDERGVRNRVGVGNNDPSTCPLSHARGNMSPLRVWTKDVGDHRESWWSVSSPFRLNVQRDFPDPRSLGREVRSESEGSCVDIFTFTFSPFLTIPLDLYSLLTKHRNPFEREGCKRRIEYLLP